MLVKIESPDSEDHDWIEGQRRLAEAVSRATQMRAHIGAGPCCMRRDAVNSRKRQAENESENAEFAEEGQKGHFSTPLGKTCRVSHKT